MMPISPEALGITATIPVEIPLAAGRQLLDLNNLFISSPAAGQAIKLAERDGFPRNCCSWIKGIYGMVRLRQIRRMIFVTGGDCSNTHALMETLLPDLEEVHTFSFPYPEDQVALGTELERFCQTLGISLARAEEQRMQLVPLRTDLEELDRLTWLEGRCTGQENFRWLVASSDFAGDPALFHDRLRAFLAEARARSPRQQRIRLGVLGVPSVFGNLIDTLEQLGGDVVFNEIPRQFAMLGPMADLVDQYTRYTYPYGVWTRIKDIRKEVQKRGIHGIIHYTQSFCHRQIHDILIRREIGVPVLTLEGENPGLLDQRTRLRIESYMEILQSRLA